MSEVGEWGVVLFLALVLAWVLVSRRLSARSVTAPIVLMVTGLLLARTDGISIDLDTEQFRLLIEVTLALILFTDASRISIARLEVNGALAGRLLLLGLPLTILGGIAASHWLFGDTSLWVAAVLATTVAPTDAALSSSILENERVPQRLRDLVNVESGLNDGLASPILLFFAAGALATEGAVRGNPLIEVLVELGIALVVGAGAGRLGGAALSAAHLRAYSMEVLEPIAPFALALGVYFGTVALGGNGFVAAFVCGLSFGSGVARHRPNHVISFTDRVGLLLGFAVWFVFGIAVLEPALVNLTWQTVVFAALALTVLRMVPVALALLGTNLNWRTVVLIGWLGPRGLASIVFGILALDLLVEPDGGVVAAAMAITVAMSVIAHGLSAGPLATWFERAAPRDQLAATGAPPDDSTGP